MQEPQSPVESANAQDPNNPLTGSALAQAVAPKIGELPGWERQTLEKLVLTTVQEQRRARLWKYIWRFSVLFFLLGLLLLGVSQKNVDNKNPNGPNAGPHTAMVEIRGETSSESHAGAEPVIAAMRAALEDAQSKALVLLINSPGGSPVQAGLINDEIVRLRDLHKKPIYVVVEEACASAAYYIAAAADGIYVDKASIVGSIGVLMDGFGFTGLMDKLGIERRLMTAGENKGMLDPFSPQTEAQRKFAQNLLNTIHAQFIEVVKKGRGDRLKVNQDTFTGLFWSGQQAVEMGLADGLGSLDSVARDVVKFPTIVDYTEHENVFARLAKQLGMAIGEGAVRSLRSAPDLR